MQTKKLVENPRNDPWDGQVSRIPKNIHRSGESGLNFELLAYLSLRDLYEKFENLQLHDIYDYYYHFSRWNCV